MAANASRSKAVWDLVVKCPSCEKWVCQRIGAIGQKMPDGPLGPALWRLRCSSCGQAYLDAWIKRGERWIAMERRALWWVTTCVQDFHTIRVGHNSCATARGTDLDLSHLFPDLGLNNHNLRNHHRGVPTKTLVSVLSPHRLIGERLTRFGMIFERSDSERFLLTNIGDNGAASFIRITAGQQHWGMRFDTEIQNKADWARRWTLSYPQAPDPELKPTTPPGLLQSASGKTR